MSIIAKESNGEYHNLPGGNHQAVCFDVWEIGIQKGEYKGVPNAAYKIIVGFETAERIVSEDDFNGKRYRCYKWYTLSLGKKSVLRQDLTSWRGKEFTKEELRGFDIENLVGANCMLNVISKEDGKPKISSVASLPKGLPKITPENTRSTPDWVLKQRAKAITHEEAESIWSQKREMEEAAEAHGAESDIPF